MPYERKTSDILVSEELRKILTQIESQSAVAALLLKKRHSNEDLAEDFVNHISVSSQDKGKISYLTKERAATMDESELWTSSRRFHSKPGGFISKVFKNVPAREVEIFSTLFRNVSNRVSADLRVVRGERIRDFYYYEAYAGDCGSLGASCMRYDNCQKYMDIYVDNPEIVSMLVMLDDGGALIGRALLWDFDGYKIMDRIYTANDEKLAFYFKEWATSNNYLFKSNQNWFDTMSFEKIGDKKQQLKLAIKLPNIKYRYYPYMDTFKFYDPAAGIICNYQPAGDFYTICTPDGSKYGSDYLVPDIFDSVFRYRNDAVYARYAGGFTSPGNAYYSEINDDYIRCSDAKYDDELNDYIFNDENDVHNEHERIRERLEHIARRREERAKKAEKAAKNLESEGIRVAGNISELEELISRYSQNGDSNIFDIIARSISPGSFRTSLSEEPVPSRGENDASAEGEQGPDSDIFAVNQSDLPF